MTTKIRGLSNQKGLSTPIKVLGSAVILLLVVVIAVAIAQGNIEPVINSLNSTQGMNSELF